jgi:hypothetical protein
MEKEYALQRIDTWYLDCFDRNYKNAVVLAAQRAANQALQAWIDDGMRDVNLIAYITNAVPEALDRKKVLFSLMQGSFSANVREIEALLAEDDVPGWSVDEAEEQDLLAPAYKHRNNLRRFTGAVRTAFNDMFPDELPLETVHAHFVDTFQTPESYVDGMVSTIDAMTEHGKLLLNNHDQIDPDARQEELVKINMEHSMMHVLMKGLRAVIGKVLQPS